jgi:hypothetical protein
MLQQELSKLRQTKPGSLNDRPFGHIHGERRGWRVGHHEISRNNAGELRYEVEISLNTQRGRDAGQSRGWTKDTNLTLLLIRWYL